MQDDSIATIYAAVGEAMSKWETLEAHLSFTYSIFEGRPVDHKFIEEYGRENSIFKNRMERLEKSAERYFQSKPDQTQEGRFACLLKQAKELSSYRHNIAHGMVVGVDLPGSQVFVLVPPAHGFFQEQKEQSERFIKTARNLGVDESPDRFERAATKILRPRSRQSSS